MTAPKPLSHGEYLFLTAMAAVAIFGSWNLKRAHTMENTPLTQSQKRYSSTFINGWIAGSSGMVHDYPPKLAEWLQPAYDSGYDSGVNALAAADKEAIAEARKNSQ